MDAYNLSIVLGLSIDAPHFSVLLLGCVMQLSPIERHYWDAADFVILRATVRQFHSIQHKTSYLLAELCSVLLLAFKVSQAAVIDLNLPSSSELSISNAELGTTNGSLNITWNAAEDNPPSIRLELLCSTAGLVGSIEQVDGKDGHAAMTHIDFSRTPASWACTFSDCSLILSFRGRIYSSCIIKALGVG